MGLAINQGLILWQTAGWKNDEVVKVYIYSCVGFVFQILSQLYRENVYLGGILYLSPGFEPADTSVILNICSSIKSGGDNPSSLRGSLF